jgi:Protein of unknown function (DUF1553)/Protein of unknown function (DUF1549)/Planctomycete cytochrome C
VSRKYSDRNYSDSNPLCGISYSRALLAVVLLKSAMAKKSIQSGLLASLLLLAFHFEGSSQETAVQSAALKILQSKCAVCHGASQISALDLRTRDSLLKGGSRGPAIVPGNAGESLLYRAAAHEGEPKMPPGSASPLPAEELATLKKWINEGAVWPSAPAQAQHTEPAWWSFKSLRRPVVPQSSNPSVAASPIDLFIADKLKNKNLKPAPLADNLTLLRRAYFDLVGLPPSPDEVKQYLADSSPNAYEKLIDSLLASPRYGERWARHWLDVVRYADSAGFEGDVYYPNAWRYRDYVIKSFNEDKPYDRFVQEQIAGDELWPDNLDLAGFYDVPYEKLEHLEARVGTAMYTFGPEIQESHLDGAKLRYERLTDAVDTTASAFMGVSLMCARCHDHKFDPFSQRDYFRLQAVFAASQPVQVPVVTTMSATHRDEAYHGMIALAEARQAYRNLEKAVKDRVIAARKNEFPADVVRAFETPAEKRTPKETELAAPLLKAYSEIKTEAHFTDSERELHQQLTRRLVNAVLDVPQEDGSHRVRFDGFFDAPAVTVLGHIDTELIPDTYVLNRGDLGRNRSKVLPGLPGIFADGSEPEDIPAEAGGARYRKRLALWLTRPDHPLTARVMVNRIWQGHFGRGIVPTANDFGRQGQAPSHPELLDWLAAEFVAQGWSIKAMQRLIMLSSTYQMSSRFSDDRNSTVDPENVYVWRMNRRRLEAEAIWDAMHASAGTLNLKMSGRPVMPPLSPAEMSALRVKSWWVPPAEPSEANRRAVYILSRRNFSFPMFDKFDRPDNATSCPRREMTTVAPQALWTLNNAVSYELAKQLATRVVKQHPANSAAWIDEAWSIALARKPSFQESKEALALLERLTSQARSKLKSDSLSEIASLNPAVATGLVQLCLAVFNLNEFIFVD